LGVFAYHANDLSNTGAALLALTLFFIPGFFGDIPDYRNKFDMSTGYFLLSCFLLFVMFSLVRRMTSKYPPSPKNPVVFLGRNSLLFLYVHFAVIAVLSARLHLQDKVGLFRHYPVMFWLFILSVSLLVMISCLYAAGWVPIKNHFDGIWMWLLLVVLVWLVPVMIEKEGFIRWLEAGFGILTGMYYHRLRFAILSRDA
jgi:hypothetical protein